MNALKRSWLAGTPTLNGWLVSPCAFTAETFARAGWDSVTVDLQHGVQDYLSMIACFQAMQAAPVTLMARVPWNEPGIIGKVLDGGAMGVICPMVNNREDALRLVDACRYPPMGRRSNGPIRMGGFGPGNYQRTANQTVLCIAMIETTEAVANMDAILDVDGIDAVYVGPTDLCFSMGMEPHMDCEEVEVLAIYERLLRACKSRGMFAGLHCAAPEYAARMHAMGFDFATINSDSGLWMQAATAAIQKARGDVVKLQKSVY